MKTNRNTKALFIVALVLAVVLAAWHVVELGYGRAISPDGIQTIGDYFDRFGEPRSVRMVRSKGRSYYELTQAKNAPIDFLIPTPPAAYVFDEEGKFVTWCKAPGDDPNHRKEWQLKGANRVPIWKLKRQFWPPFKESGYASLADRELSLIKQAVVKAAQTDETWDRLGAERLTKTPFAFDVANADYYVYFDQPDRLDVLIPSGGMVGWHSCFVRATVVRETLEVVAIEESFWP